MRLLARKQVSYSWPSDWTVPVIVVMIIGLAVNRGDIPIELVDSWLTMKTMEVVVSVMTKWSNWLSVNGIIICLIDNSGSNRKDSNP